MAPEFLVEDFQDKIILRAGTTKKLEMPFRSAPQPDVSWTVDGAIIKEDRIREDTDKDITILTMKDVRRADGGDYRCRLTNKHGEATLTVNVTVIGKFHSYCHRHW